MKLLLDENLAPILARLLADLYPGSSHVRDCGLKQSPDEEVWQYARTYGFTLVSKDSDFEQRAVLRGHPPKIIRVRLGNCSTQQLADLLRKYSVVIHTFESDATESVLILP